MPVLLSAAVIRTVTVPMQSDNHIAFFVVLACVVALLLVFTRRPFWVCMFAIFTTVAYFSAKAALWI